MSDSTHAQSRGSDLSVGGLTLFIEERANNNSDDYWDANWLTVRAECRGKNSLVSVTGPILHLSEVAALKVGCARLAAGEITETGLFCMEPNLKIELWSVPGGQLIGKIRITPDHKSEMHDFGFAMDAGELAAVETACSLVLEHYPMRGKPGVNPP